MMTMMKLRNSVNWVVDNGAYEESNTEIRMPGLLLRFYKTLDDSNPSEVSRDGFDEDEIFDDADG